MHAAGLPSPKPDDDVATKDPYAVKDQKLLPVWDPHLPDLLAAAVCGMDLHGS